MRVHAKLLQSCLTLYDLMDCTPPSFSVHGILQARILEWVARPPFDLPDSGIKPSSLNVCCITGEFFTAEPLGKPRGFVLDQYCVDLNSGLA